MSPADKSRRCASSPAAAGPGAAPSRIRFEGYGEEMIQKKVSQSGSSGRVYLPLEWVGKNVKIIRID